MPVDSFSTCTDAKPCESQRCCISNWTLVTDTPTWTPHCNTEVPRQALSVRAYWKWSNYGQSTWAQENATAATARLLLRSELAIHGGEMYKYNVEKPRWRDAVYELKGPFSSQVIQVVINTICQISTLMSEVLFEINQSHWNRKSQTIYDWQSKVTTW